MFNPLLLMAAIVGAAAPVPAATPIAQITDSNFESEVVNHDKPVVLDFYADWCGPCRQFAPTFHDCASDYAKTAKFGRVDSDNTPKLDRAFNVTTIPSIVVIKKNADGKLVYYKTTGNLSKAALKTFIDESLSDTKGGTPLPPLK